MKQISVLLAEDHVVVREGVRMMLNLDGGFEVVGEVDDGRRAVAFVMRFRPAVVLMDITMPSLNGLEATRQVLHAAPSTIVLMLSANADPGFVEEAVASGAAGYLLKQSTTIDICQAIRVACDGSPFFTIPPAARLADRDLTGCGQGDLRLLQAHLSSREVEVLQLIAEGKPNKQTATELQISIKTVEKHREHLMHKLDIHTVAGLTRYAAGTGVIGNGSKLPGV